MIELRRSINIIVLLCFAVTIVACAGREAHPVKVVKLGDQKLSCESLSTEMRHIESEIRHLAEENDKLAWNILMGGGGALVFWPALFAMDFSDAQEKEIRAYKQRYDHLQRLSYEKECGYESSLEKPKDDKAYTNSSKKN